MDEEAPTCSTLKRIAPLLARGNLRRLNPMSATSTKQGWEGFERNEDVKRSRKPEGVAEPGEASPAGHRGRWKRRIRVAVAARGLTRCRGANLRRGPLESGVFGDGGGGESKRANGRGHRAGLRSSEGKPKPFERGANGKGGCPLRETKAAGRFASNRAEPGLNHIFG